MAEEEDIDGKDYLSEFDVQSPGSYIDIDEESIRPHIDTDNGGELINEEFPSDDEGMENLEIVEEPIEEPEVQAREIDEVETVESGHPSDNELQNDENEEFNEGELQNDNEEYNEGNEEEDIEELNEEGHEETQYESANETANETINDTDALQEIDEIHLEPIDELRSIVELDSEDEIDNLEEKSEGQEDGIEEFSFEGRSDLNDDGEDGDFEEQNGTLESSLKSIEVPVFVNIRGDEYLLVPFYDTCNYELQDMISLFDLDEISGRTLEQFFRLLRGNGDLIDAYNFNMEDELKVDIPELSLCVTEDNIYTREIRLEDIFENFHQLKHNSERTHAEKVPDKLTILVTMQQRFITKYNRVAKCASESKTFADLLPNNNGEEVDEHQQKKRKLDT